MRRGVEWLVLSLCMSALVATMAWNGGTGRFDLALSDLFMAQRARTPHPEIIIVAIDDRSLALIGRWPWPRSLHAELIRKITLAQPRAIGFDLVLSEPDPYDAKSDADLAEAIAQSGKTVLPVIMEGGETRPIQVTPPIPEFSASASALAHIHVEVDRDGIVRSVFLREGLRGQWWNHLALEILNIGEWSGRDRDLPGERRPTPATGAVSGDAWLRDHHIQVPYAGPPGTFPRVSYVDVLNGAVSEASLRGKYVLVGATAAGMGDAYPTPVSGESRPMPGIEIVANVTDSMLRGISLRHASPLGNVRFNLVPVVLALFGLLWLSPRQALVATLALFAMTLLAAYAALSMWHTIFAPGAALLGLILLYPLWVWRRLEAALGYLGQEFERLNREGHFLPARSVPASGDFLDRRILAMEQAAEYLRDLHHFVSDSLESLPDATLVADRNGVVVLANLAAAQYFQNGSPRLLRGRRLLDLLSRIQTFNDERLFNVHASPSGEQGVSGIEARDAQGRDLFIKCAPCFSAAGGHIGWIASLVDISTVRQAERKRDEALRFISHDMRSPQASILALLDLRAANPSAIGEHELFERISRYARKTLVLADDFVQLARAESREYRFEQVDIGQILIDAIDEVWAQAQAKRIRIDTDVPDEPIAGMADRALLTRAIINLIHNAVKYSPEGQVVHCSAACRDGSWFVTVRDHGPGIAPEDQPDLFRRFRRFHAEGQEPGVGLGLVFVKTVIDRHGGEISFDSEPGRGSEFRIRMRCLPNGMAPESMI